MKTLYNISGVIFISLLFVIINSGNLQATHIRAGEITAELINCQSYSYVFTVTGYTDTGSNVQFGGGEINFGDGTIEQFNTEDFDEKRDLGDELAITIFRRTHTFPGPGVYTITFREFNRNAGVVNMDNSVNTPFYIETKIVIDPLLGCNNTPVLTIPPIDGACVGAEFIHNPGAYDPDGDSLVYSLIEPLRRQGVAVDGYTFPDDPIPTRSALCVPFIYNERVIATVTLVHEDPGHFKPHHLRLLRIITNQAAIAIRNAQLFSNLKAQRRHLEGVLHSMTDALLVLDEAGHIRLINPAAETLLQVNRENDAKDRPLSEFLMVDTVFEPLVEIVQAELADNQRWSFETRSERRQRDYQVTMALWNNPERDEALARQRGAARPPGPPDRSPCRAG